MATFAGKQAGYADPTMRKEPGVVADTETRVFKGVQPPTAADPTISGFIAALYKVRPDATDLYTIGGELI